LREVEERREWREIEKDWRGGERLREIGEVERKRKTYA
jgi:hypothetical protein